MCMIHVYPSCFPAFKGRLNSWEENLPGDCFTQQVTRVLKSTANEWLQNGSFEESALLEPMSSQSGVGGWGCCAGLRLHGASLQRLGSAFQTAGHCVCCGGCHSVKADWDQEGTLGSPATPATCSRFLGHTPSEPLCKLLPRCGASRSYKGQRRLCRAWTGFVAFDRRGLGQATPQ